MFEDARILVERVRASIDAGGQPVLADIVQVANYVSILVEAIENGGWDFSVCGTCPAPVVCLPDGLPTCERCAMTQMHGDDMLAERDPSDDEGVATNG